MTKTKIDHAECRCEFDIRQTGSIIRDTAASDVLAFRTHLSVESSEPLERIARVIRLAKRTCFAEQLVRNPIDLTSTFTVNGESVDADAFA